jgi:hypothetical protein
MQVCRAVALIAVWVSAAPAAVAQERFPDTEYFSGKAGFSKKVKGTLVIEPAALRFVTKGDKPIFEIPMAVVVSASATKEQDSGSFGRKMALGIFASKTEEFLQVETRTTEGADVVIFKTKKKQAPGMAAKVNYFREQLPRP